MIIKIFEDFRSDQKQKITSDLIKEIDYSEFVEFTEIHIIEPPSERDLQEIKALVKPIATSDFGWYHGEIFTDYCVIKSTDYIRIGDRNFSHYNYQNSILYNIKISTCRDEWYLCDLVGLDQSWLRNGRFLKVINASSISAQHLYTIDGMDGLHEFFKNLKNL